MSILYQNGTIEHTTPIYMPTQKELIIFDLDGTLAVSKSAIEADMAGLICDLLNTYAVAVISGGKLAQMTDQYVSHIPCREHFDRLFLLPTSGAQCYMWHNNEWQQQYAYTLSDEEKKRIFDALVHVRTEMGDNFFDSVPFEEQAEDRDTQVTFSALGQHARHDIKALWDPDRTKRKAMQEKLQNIIPEFEIRIGGLTSIDITKPGIDKGFGLTKFFSITPYTIENSLFIGDALIPGGNDYPAKEIGIESISVKNPEETKQIIINILAKKLST